MSKSISAIISVVLFAAAWQNGYCQDPIAATVGDLSVPVATDILTILINGTVRAVGNCADSSNTSQVQYWLYTRQNPNGAVLSSSLSEIDPTKPIIILLHGWGGNANIDYIAVIKNAYLQRYDANIISVDYSVYVVVDYQTGYCYVPAIGLNVAKFICNLVSTFNIKLSDLHVVGHSLGAHTAGFAGAATQGMCGTIGRITGLDPAGPLYQDISASQRLDATDATLVDVIHTNERQFGYVGDCGDVDFYVNCGYYQPNCLEHTFSSATTLANIAQLPLTFVVCSHQRSCYLFAESINSNSFYGTSCLVCLSPTLCSANILNPSYTYMGESCRIQPPDREYILDTKSTSPYALGPAGPLN